MFIFLKIILILNLEEKNLAGQEKKIYSDLTFSQYNHIQNFEEEKIIPALLDLIIPRSPKREGGILFYLCPSVLPKYFSFHFSQQLLMAEI